VGEGASERGQLAARGTEIMAQLADKTHFDKHTLARVNSAVMVGLIGGGLLVCVLGAVIYDLERLFSVW
jgi:hypothetical protein